MPTAAQHHVERVGRRAPRLVATAGRRLLLGVRCVLVALGHELRDECRDRAAERQMTVLGRAGRAVTAEELLSKPWQEVQWVNDALVLYVAMCVRGRLERALEVIANTLATIGGPMTMARAEFHV